MMRCKYYVRKIRQFLFYKTLCNLFTKAIIDELNGDSDYLFGNSPNK